MRSGMPGKGPLTEQAGFLVSKSLTLLSAQGGTEGSVRLRLFDDFPVPIPKKG